MQPVLPQRRIPGEGCPGEPLKGRIRDVEKLSEARELGIERKRREAPQLNAGRRGEPRGTLMAAPLLVSKPSNGRGLKSRAKPQPDAGGPEGPQWPSRTGVCPGRHKDKVRAKLGRGKMTTQEGLEACGAACPVSVLSVCARTIAAKIFVRVVPTTQRNSREDAPAKDAPAKDKTCVFCLKSNQESANLAAERPMPREREREGVDGPRKGLSNRRTRWPNNESPAGRCTRGTEPGGRSEDPRRPQQRKPLLQTKMGPVRRGPKPKVGRAVLPTAFGVESVLLHRGSRA